MAYSLLTHTGAGSSGNGGTSVTTTGIDTTGADLLVVAVSSYEGVVAPVVSDSVGGNSNTWATSPPTTKSVTGQIRVQLHYCKNPAHVGASHIITIAGGVGAYCPSVCFASFSGSNTTAPFDQENGATDGSASSGTPTLNTGSITPSENDELIIASCGWSGNAATASIGSGMTITDQSNYAADAFGVALAYKIQTTAAAINPQWSWNNFDYLAAQIASFKASGGGGGGGGTATIVGSLSAQLGRVSNV